MTKNGEKSKFLKKKKLSHSLQRDETTNACRSLCECPRSIKQHYEYISWIPSAITDTKNACYPWWLTIVDFPKQYLKLILSHYCVQVAGSAIPLDFSETHVIIILILLILIMVIVISIIIIVTTTAETLETLVMILVKVGMCTGMIYNLIRKLTEDKEDILASR